MSTAVRVLLADDAPDLRALTRLTLEKSKAFEVVAEAGDGQAAVDLCGIHHPDLVLLDLAMPVLDGIDAIPLIRRCSPETCIVVLSGYNADAMGPTALNGGADAYLEKRIRPDDLVPRLLAACQPAVRPDGHSYAEEPPALLPAAVAHDLRAPLQAILGFADLLETMYGTRLDERGREFVGWIVRSATAMSDLIGDLSGSASVGTRGTPEGPVSPRPLPATRRSDQPADERATTGPLDVLLVEDSDSHARLVGATLGRAAPPGYHLRRAESLRQARAMVAEATPTCILLDLSLPDGNSLDSLAEMRVTAPDVPIVVLTSVDDDALALAAVQQGAQDYLVKGRLDVEVLGRSIHYAIERTRLEAELATLALHDALTGLPNRTLVLDRLRVALGRTSRANGTVVVLYLDLDGFKEINDRLGHAAGDRVLVEVGRRLQGSVRPQDTAGRMGGDEFVVICDAPWDSSDGVIEQLQRRVLEAFARPIDLDGVEERVGVSIGIVAAEAGDETNETLLARADAAMYRAKRRR